MTRRCSTCYHGVTHRTEGDEKAAVCANKDARQYGCKVKGNECCPKWRRSF